MTNIMTITPRRTNRFESAGAMLERENKSPRYVHTTGRLFSSRFLPADDFAEQIGSHYYHRRHLDRRGESFLPATPPRGTVGILMRDRRLFAEPRLHRIAKKKHVFRAITISVVVRAVG